jgi:hypothetical protein
MHHYFKNHFFTEINKIEKVICIIVDYNNMHVNLFKMPYCPRTIKSNQRSVRHRRAGKPLRRNGVEKDTHVHATRLRNGVIDNQTSCDAFNSFINAIINVFDVTTENLCDAHEYKVELEGFFQQFLQQQSDPHSTYSSIRNYFREQNIQYPFGYDPCVETDNFIVHIEWDTDNETNPDFSALEVK